MRNAVSFDIEKTEAVLFTTARKNSLIKLAEDNKLSIGGKEIKFSVNTTRWLGIILDPGLKLKAHVNQRIEKTRNAAARVQGIIGKYGLASGLTRRIHIAAVHSTILYGAEIWWDSQKTLRKIVQGVINRGARAVTEMWKNTPIEILLVEANLRNVKVILNSRQRKFSARLATLPDENPVKNILPVTFRNGDGSAQPMEQPIGDTDWTRRGKREGKQLGIRLARSIATVAEVDPAEGIEAIRQVALGTFPGTVIISPKEQALEEANTPRNGQVIWSDGSRLEDGRTGSAAVCRNAAGIWTAKRSALGDNKEVFDAELWGIHLAL